MPITRGKPSSKPKSRTVQPAKGKSAPKRSARPNPQTGTGALRRAFLVGAHARRAQTGRTGHPAGLHRRADPAQPVHRQPQSHHWQHHRFPLPHFRLGALHPSHRPAGLRPVAGPAPHRKTTATHTRTQCRQFPLLSLAPHFYPRRHRPARRFPHSRGSRLGRRAPRQFLPPQLVEIARHGRRDRDPAGLVHHLCDDDLRHLRPRPERILRPDLFPLADDDHASRDDRAGRVPSRAKPCRTVLPRSPRQRRRPKSSPYSRRASRTTTRSGENVIHWQLPAVKDILDEGAAPAINEDFIQKRARLIEETLASFGAPAQVVEISRGPTITSSAWSRSSSRRRNGRDARARQQDRLPRR